MSKIPIIAFAPHPWDENEWMNRQQLLSRLGKRGWPVIYSEGALDVWQRLGERWNRSPWLNTYTEQDSVMLGHSGRILPRWQKSKFIDCMALSSHASFLKKIARTKSPSKRHIALIFNPQFWPYVNALKSDFVAFHVYDAYSKMQRWDEALETMQRDLVDRANLISAASEAMARELPEPGPKKARILHNGVDEGLFFGTEVLKCPPDLEKIPSPRIAYAGKLNRKVDFNLVYEISQAKPEWHWILIGKLEEQEILSDPSISKAFAKTRLLKNIHFLGEKIRLEIPEYVNHVEVNAMCYRSDGGGWWTAAYPLKLHECLATGKPLISAKLEAVLNFSGVVDLVETPAQWIKAIEAALHSGGVGTPQERRSIARQNTWNRRVDLLEQWLVEMING